MSPPRTPLVMETKLPIRVQVARLLAWLDDCGEYRLLDVAQKHKWLRRADLILKLVEPTP